MGVNSSGYGALSLQPARSKSVPKISNARSIFRRGRAYRELRLFIIITKFSVDFQGDCQRRLRPLRSIIFVAWPSSLPRVTPLNPPRFDPTPRFDPRQDSTPAKAPPAAEIRPRPKMRPGTKNKPADTTAAPAMAA